MANAATSRSQRRVWPLSGTTVGAATSHSQGRGWPPSGTVVRAATSHSQAKDVAAVGHSGGCRDKPLPAKGVAAVGHKGGQWRHFSLDHEERQGKLLWLCFRKSGRRFSFGRGGRHAVGARAKQGKWAVVKAHRVLLGAEDWISM